jgi:hypothetical protein
MNIQFKWEYQGYEKIAEFVERYKGSFVWNSNQGWQCVGLLYPPGVTERVQFFLGLLTLPQCTLLLTYQEVVWLQPFISESDTINPQNPELTL